MIIIHTTVIDQWSEGEALAHQMKFELNAHYKVLFHVEDSQIKFEAGINKLIGDNEQLRDGCQPIIVSET